MFSYLQVIHTSDQGTGVDPTICSELNIFIKWNTNMWFSILETGTIDYIKKNEILTRHGMVAHVLQHVQVASSPTTSWPVLRIRFLVKLSSSLSFHQRLVQTCTCQDPLASNWKGFHWIQCGGGTACLIPVHGHKLRSSKFGNSSYQGIRTASNSNESHKATHQSILSMHEL